MDHPSRLRRLRRQMAQAGGEALLVTHLPDVRYLCGFTGSNAAVAVTSKRAILFTDGRYTSQAKEESRGVRVVIAKKSALAEACASLLDAGAKAAFFDPEHMTVAQLDSLRSALPKERRRSFLVQSKEPLIAAMRMVKDAEEQALIARAAALGDDLFERILAYIEPGVSEVSIAAELEHAARMAGAEAMSFATIVASGRRSALPHGTASAELVPRQGFVTLDFGVILRGYCSDVTRTVHIGRATAEERSAYEAVDEAQQAGLMAVRDGVSCGEVDKACRTVLERHRLGKYFTHSTGHGLGLEIHESPRIAGDQATKLEEGMVVTVEPGVYLPGQFGIRIEDSVVVEANGARILTQATKAWIEL